MKKLKITLLFKIIIILSLITCIRVIYSLNNVKSKYNLNITNIEGIIQKIKINGNKLSLEIKSKENIIVNYKIETFEEKEQIENEYKIGDKVIIKGLIKTPNSNTNFNLFNYRNYLLSKKIYYLFDAEEIKIIHSNNIIYNIKNSIINKIDKLDNSYLKAFILGDTSDIDENVNTSYQTNGINHLLAISGMHISLLAGTLYKLLKKIIKKEYKIIILISILLLFYLFLINYPPSAIRTSLLFVLIKIFKNKISSSLVLILICDILLIFNPYYIYNVGFVFSFIISFSLMLFGKITNNYNNYFIKVLLTSLISFLVSIPILINNYFSINFLSIIFNIFFVPYVSIIVFPFTLITFIFPLLMPILNILIYILENVSLFCSSINIFTMILPKCNIIITVIYYILIVFILYKLQYKKYKYLIILIVLLFIHTNIKYLNNNLEITMLDVGQGDSILLSLPNNKANILIDTGGITTYNTDEWKKTKSYSLSKNTIIPYLKSVGIKKLDYLIITHGDYDHIGEAINLIDNFNVENVILNDYDLNSLEQNLINVLNIKNIKYYKGYDNLKIGNNELIFLNTEDCNNENDNSNVIYFKSNNFQLLFMGDAGINRENDILEKYNLNNIDILKVGHHGSKNSSGKTFINAINPKYSLISVGRNNKFNHPHDEALINLSDTKIYRTDINGSVLFKINDKLNIKTCME